MAEEPRWAEWVMMAFNRGSFATITGHASKRGGDSIRLEDRTPLVRTGRLYSLLIEPPKKA